MRSNELTTASTQFLLAPCGGPASPIGWLNIRPILAFRPPPLGSVKPVTIQGKTLASQSEFREGFAGSMHT